LRQIDETQHEQQPAPRTLKKQEGVRIGKVMVLAQESRAALNEYTQRLRVQSYQVRETEHFVVCQKRSSNRTILLHVFGRHEIDADLICFIEHELAPSGIIASAQEFGAMLFAVIASPFPAPRNQDGIWLHFCLNTLSRLREQLAHPPVSIPSVSYITPFAAMYRRVFELCIGESLLDVGCSFGFLPVLLAEHAPDVRITGCDNNPDALRFSSDLSRATGTQHVTLTLRDVLAANFLDLGRFDTVIAIHLLEHLTEQELPVALTHLLRATSKRLLIAVPYEEKVQPLFGHHQAFTPEKLHAWGKWCVERLGENSRYWCEDLMGGLLVVDRPLEEK
jgi:SAM-dependent methyltransferase